MIDSLIKYGLIACFFSLILTPFGLPVPEEISLLAAGFIVKKQGSSIVVGWIVGFLGVTLGDVISWTMGKFVGLTPKGFVSRLIGKEQIQDIEAFYDRWGNWTIVFARQMPGMRFPAFFFAGASGVSLGRFYLIDGLSALITVNVFFFLGYAFAEDLHVIRDFINEFQSYASGIATVLLLTALAYLFWRRHKRKKKAQQETSSPEEQKESS